MSWPDAPLRRVVPEDVFLADLRWDVDAEHRLWLRAGYERGWIYLRMNPSFPDDPLYSLLVAEDETYDFDDFPANWDRTGDLVWPEPDQ